VKHTLATIILAAAIATSGVASPPPSSFDCERILNAIQQVETGGCKDPSNAVGDNGKAIGAFQIHHCYWKDATDFDKSIGGKYSDCKNEAYARKIVIAYLTRYCKNWDNETVARMHNGGPRGHLNPNTIKYWNKIQKELNK
jgi:hypothetical protein